MEKDYLKLAEKSLLEGGISDDEVRWILTSDEVELLPLLQASYKVKHRYFGDEIKIHILNNVQSGNCSEDCKYCAQSGKSEAEAQIYPMKSEEEIIAEADYAYKSGAVRYCMVFSGRDLGKNRISTICSVVEKIKKKYPMDICVSAGFLTPEDAGKLACAGVNRYNHNINTSRSYYNSICSSHDYTKRLDTIITAKEQGLEICSGIIIGMGETPEDICRMMSQLKEVGASSVPVNFFIPIEGHRLEKVPGLTPSYCLKVLAAFRLALPAAEIRCAAGREYHLRSMQALCLYPVNSLFAKGYLTTGGDSVEQTKKLIADAGFKISPIPG